jgi:hypothetical protein
LVFPSPAADEEDEEAIVAAAFRKPALALGTVLLQTMEIIEQQILTCYNASILSPPPKTDTDFVAAQNRLVEAVNIARSHLEKISDQKRKSLGDVRLPSKVFDSCACMIFLLQVSRVICRQLLSLTSPFEDDPRNTVQS